MQVEYHKIWSQELNQDMELKIYGHTGKPVIVFPTSWGRFYEYEDQGMVAYCQEFIDAGNIRLITVDSVDPQSWLNRWLHPADRAKRHLDYDNYIVREVNHFIREHCHAEGRFMATGCSLGAYHAVNFFLRHPDMFDSVISLSGTYSLKSLVGDYMDDNVYYNSPLHYLPQLTDPWYLDQYRTSTIVLCAGQGAWEYHARMETGDIKQIMDNKKIPNWVDFWGEEVHHDWPWWHKQIYYFLSHLDL